MSVSLVLRPRPAFCRLQYSMYHTWLGSRINTCTSLVPRLSCVGLGTRLVAGYLNCKGGETMVRTYSWGHWFEQVPEEPPVRQTRPRLAIYCNRFWETCEIDVHGTNFVRMGNQKDHTSIRMHVFYHRSYQEWVWLSLPLSLSWMSWTRGGISCSASSITSSTLAIPWSITARRGMKDTIV